MRRLPGILLLTVATLIVVVALLVSGLRLVLPQLNSWRPQVLEKVSAMAGVPVDASNIVASWQTFGPTLDVRDVKAGLNDGGELSAKRVTLALDVWQKPAAYALAVSRSDLLAAGRFIPIPPFKRIIAVKG
ncbi:membrane protein [Klebsiella michiganensis]|uniref:Membrane protein n=1 Tax=Klebsiella michiganensis TaxID=1134687 RepID=A0A7H4PGX8_9ENTR|nr:membrane protein [Klebsiella michiganensis]